MKWLSRAGVAAGLIILIGFPLLYQYRRNMLDSFRERFGPDARELSNPQWSFHNDNLRGLSETAGTIPADGDNAMRCLSREQVRKYFKDDGAYLKIMSGNYPTTKVIEKGAAAHDEEDDDDFHWIDGEYRVIIEEGPSDRFYWIVGTYRPEIAVVYHATEEQLCYPATRTEAPEADTHADGFERYRQQQRRGEVPCRGGLDRSAIQYRFVFLGVMIGFWGLTLIVLGLRLRAYLMKHSS